MDIRGTVRGMLKGPRVYRPVVEVPGEAAERGRPGRRIGLLGRTAIGAGVGTLLWGGISLASDEIRTGEHNKAVHECSKVMGKVMKSVETLPSQCKEKSLSRHIIMIQPEYRVTTAEEAPDPGALYNLPTRNVFVEKAEEHTDYRDLGRLLALGAVVGAAAPYIGPGVQRVRNRIAG